MCSPALSASLHQELEAGEGYKVSKTQSEGGAGCSPSSTSGRSSAGDHQSRGAALRGAGQGALWELCLRPGPLLLRDLRWGDQRQGSHLPGPPLHRLPAALQRLHLG